MAGRPFYLGHKEQSGCSVQASDKQYGARALLLAFCFVIRHSSSVVWWDIANSWLSRNHELAIELALLFAFCFVIRHSSSVVWWDIANSWLSCDDELAIELAKSDHTTNDENLVNLWMNGSLAQLTGGLSEWEQMEAGASREDETDKLLSDLASIFSLLTRQDCSLPI